MHLGDNDAEEHESHFHPIPNVARSSRATAVKRARISLEQHTIRARGIQEIGSPQGLLN